MGAEPRTGHRHSWKALGSRCSICGLTRGRRARQYNDAAAVATYKAALKEKVRALRGVTLLVERATGFGGRVIEEAAVLALIEDPADAIPQDMEARCSVCGIPIHEHPDTDACADLEVRRRWHAMDGDHEYPFESCASLICQGLMPVPS